MKSWWKFLTLSVVAFTAGGIHAVAEPPPSKGPAVLIVNGRDYNPMNKGDFTWFQELNKHGFQLDNHFNGTRPLNWELIRKYNCLVIIDLPPEEKDAKGKGGPPFRKEMLELLDRYLKEGGGIFIMPDFQGYAETLKWMKRMDSYLERWGARVPADRLQDLASETRHPRSGADFIYTDQIAASPVSEGVKGIWFPSSREDNWAFHAFGSPLEVSPEWTVVARGADSSRTKPMGEVGASTEHDLLATMFHRPDQNQPPALYAIRTVGGGRLALTSLWPVFTLHGGTTWVHDGAVLNKGLRGRPSGFSKLFENTLRWLAEPSLKGDQLGGYRQDPAVLLPPNLRKSPNELFPATNVMTPPAAQPRVFRGLVGARTAYSSGKGTVAEYAAAAKNAGLDFIIFLEEFGKFSEEKLRKLEADCKGLSTDEVLLIPGYTIDTNIGNHLFLYGYDNKWPKPSQLDGAKKDRLRLQCFDKEGKLNYTDEDAKNLLWQYAGVADGRNIGYFDFTGKPGVPVRNLRLYGILGVISYRNGKQIEDLTKEYLDYVMDGDPPLACAVDLVSSPVELEAAVKAKHYLTHVAASALRNVVAAIPYGHQYGRANVNPSSGPQIKCWATTLRVMTFAGEPFVTGPYRLRPRATVSSDVGLKEIRIYSDTKLYRRILLNGAKEFDQVFEWAYERHRIFVLEAIDMEGRRALSAGLEVWCDAHFNGWCHDRQNGELWHGPFGVPGPRRPTFSQGPSWDGGGSESFIGADVGGANLLKTKEGEVEGWSRLRGGRGMEGNVYPTCWDDSVGNVAGVADHEYAPGVVANGYHTLGPCAPSPLINFASRRTQYLNRISGPNIDWHPMWSERSGGNLAMIEGVLTLKKNATVEYVDVANMVPAGFAKDSPNVPIWAIRMNNNRFPVCGAFPSLFSGPAGVPLGLGVKERYTFDIDPGGYVGVFATELGNTCLMFNLGEQPLRFLPPAYPTFTMVLPDKPSKAGDTFAWKYLVIYDSMMQPARNLHRIERIREYYGLDGKHDSGLKVKRGKLLKHFGLVDLAPENGVVEFEVPAPDFDLDIPLGLRFIGFNPNWTVGQFQIKGYSPGFYSPGNNVYRNLAFDDRDMVHLAVYTPNTPRTHGVVGHPVQCDAKDLIIEFTKLSDQPPQYHVAINNPTDQPIKTTLRKCIDLPGFDFSDTPVAVPAGGYAVVREK